MLEKWYSTPAKNPLLEQELWPIKEEIKRIRRISNEAGFAGAGAVEAYANMDIERLQKQMDEIIAKHTTGKASVDTKVSSETKKNKGKKKKKNKR